MKAIGCSPAQPTLASCEYALCRPDGSASTVQSQTQHEHLLSIVMNGQLAFTLTCTPQYLLELTLGRLFSEGLISDISDVASIHGCQKGDVVKVKLHDGAPFEQAKAVRVSTCNDAREAHLARRRRLELPPLEPAVFDRRWVFAAAEAFAQDTPMHQRSRGAHSCSLAQGRRMLFSCEDLGRHNAFDKAIGWGLRNGVDFRRCFAITSGRVPTDMAAKAVRAGIPVLLSASVPTDAALQLAHEKNLTIIGRIKPDGVAVYHDPTGSMAMPYHISSSVTKRQPAFCASALHSSVNPAFENRSSCRG